MEQIEVNENTDAELREAFPNDEQSFLEVRDMISKGLADSLAEGASILDVPPLEEQDIETLLEATNQGIREFNTIEAVGNGVTAGHAVRIGTKLNKLKIMVKNNRGIWHDYAQANIVGMSQRTIDKHRAIAKIRGVQNYLAFGIEKLSLMAGAVKSIESQDPISDLFSKYNLKFNTMVEMDFEEFKQSIASISLREKVATHGLELDQETAEKIVESGDPVTAEDLAEAKVAEAAGGQANKYFQNMLAKKSKGNTTPGSKRTKTKASTKVCSFNKAVVQLQQVITEAVKTSDEVVLKDIDAAMIDPLIENLASLKAHLTKP